MPSLLLWIGWKEAGGHEVSRLDDGLWLVGWLVVDRGRSIDTVRAYLVRARSASACTSVSCSSTILRSWTELVLVNHPTTPVAGWTLARSSLAIA